MSSSPVQLEPSSCPPRSSDRAAWTLQLFRAWKAGDSRAGEALFRELRIRLRAYFRRQPPHLVDDLVQETLVACVVARRALRCEDALLGYVYAVARRVLVHHLRSLPVVSLDEDEAIDEARPALDRVVEAHRLIGDRLTPATLLVMLRYVEGRRGVELARALDISEASVRRRVRRGLDELRRTASARD